MKRPHIVIPIYNEQCEPLMREFLNNSQIRLIQCQVNPVTPTAPGQVELIMAAFRHPQFNQIDLTHLVRRVVGINVIENPDDSDFLHRLKRSIHEQDVSRSNTALNGLVHGSCLGIFFAFATGLQFHENTSPAEMGDFISSLLHVPKISPLPPEFEGYFGNVAGKVAKDPLWLAYPFLQSALSGASPLCKLSHFGTSFYEQITKLMYSQHELAERIKFLTEHPLKPTIPK
jgi:hypothetical protein